MDVLPENVKEFVSELTPYSVGIGVIVAFLYPFVY